MLLEDPIRKGNLMLPQFHWMLQLELCGPKGIKVLSRDKTIFFLSSCLSYYWFCLKRGEEKSQKTRTKKEEKVKERNKQKKNRKKIKKNKEKKKRKERKKKKDWKK